MTLMYGAHSESKGQPCTAAIRSHVIRCTHAQWN